jgi:RNA polymerase sigma-70 factor (ECF subfamily)
MIATVVPAPVFVWNPDTIFNLVSGYFIRLWVKVCGLILLSVEPDGMEIPSAAHEDDSLYVKQCQQGDSGAFGELVYRYQDMIFSLCVRMLGNRADGEDAAQETFVKAFEAIKNFRFQALFSTWLYRIATNVCRNRSASFWDRFSKKAFRLDAEGGDEDGDCSRREVAASDPDPQEVLEKKQRMLCVREAIMKLPLRQREIVVLADVQELSYEEIQAITNMAIGTIKSRLNRGREALKRLLEGI